jgi:predicted component of type VI protein secretion system
MPYLIIVTEGLDKEPVAITLGTEGIIGREKSNNIYIDDPRASRQHAKITKEPDGSFLLIDMGSRNGIIVNSEKVSRRKLVDKDRIVVGRTTLTYNESAAAPIQAAAQPATPAAAEGKTPPGHSASDKTITAAPLGEPTKLGSDALKKAIQDVASAHSADKTAPGAKKKTPAGSAISKGTRSGNSDEAVDEEPSSGKRIMVFLAFLIFFVTILLFAKELTRRWLSNAEKLQPARNISSPEKTQDK